jgi:hypothetical protein
MTVWPKQDWLDARDPLDFCSHHDMWAGVRGQTATELGMGGRCSSKYPRGSAARKGFAGNEVRRRPDNTGHGIHAETIGQRQVQGKATPWLGKGAPTAESMVKVICSSMILVIHT